MGRLLKIESSKLNETLASKVQEGYNYLVKITAVDYTDRIEVLYFIRNLEENSDEVVRFDLDPKAPAVNTVMHMYQAADWYERELSEMFGIKIIGRDAKRLLLEKWDGKDAPLRKSFEWGKPYQSVDNPITFGKRREK